MKKHFVWNSCMLLRRTHTILPSYTLPRLCAQVGCSSTHTNVFVIGLSRCMCTDEKKRFLVTWYKVYSYHTKRKKLYMPRVHVRARSANNISRAEIICGDREALHVPLDDRRQVRLVSGWTHTTETHCRIPLRSFHLLLLQTWVKSHLKVRVWVEGKVNRPYKWFCKKSRLNVRKCGWKAGYIGGSDTSATDISNVGLAQVRRSEARAVYAHDHL